MKAAIAATLLAGASLITALPSTRRQGSTKVKFGGVNIAGFDFGCGIDGTCKEGTAFDIGSKGNGIAQMNHFVKDDGLNTFRLPVGWQFLTANNVDTALDEGAFAQYDVLVQGCLNSGAELCILDIHNYARWNGQIVGQGGPADEKLAATWAALATKYKDQTKIAFGVMNEPHDLPDINRWAQTCQAVVDAIRKAGATTQMILLPGNDFTSAGAFISNGSGAALMTVKDSDGTTDKLIFDVHKYLDSDSSGTHTECVTNNIDDAFKPLADFLRTNGRKAINTETGGGNTDSCKKFLCEQIQFLNQNSDVYIGFTSWAAGGFDPAYELVETPTDDGSGKLTDTSLVSTCVVGAWK